jgi:hypothetical protein
MLSAGIRFQARTFAARRPISSSSVLSWHRNEFEFLIDCFDTFRAVRGALGGELLFVAEMWPVNVTTTIKG